MLLIVWLLIGLLAASQRGYLRGSGASCTKLGTIAITVAAGPLNYVGANPRIVCKAPKPSR